MMLKRKWSPLSPQMRILELLNAAPEPMPLAGMHAHEFLAGLSAHAIAVNLKLLADRGFVANHAEEGLRAFELTPRGKQQLDVDRVARARLAQRLKIEIPAGMYLTAPAEPRGDEGGKVAVTPREPQPLPAPGRFDRLENREEVIAKPLTNTAIIGRAHLRLLVTRAIANPAPLTDDDRDALTAAIREAA